MFDQRNVFLKNVSPIQNLVNSEQQLHKLDVEQAIEVKFSGDSNTLQFNYNGLVINAKVDRPLMHQLGGRSWGQGLAFKSIAEIWKKKLIQNRSILEQELAEVFSRYDLTIRLKFPNNY
ncbi:hypothetical protein BJAS_P2077 [Bathymodiolus japonicus methanotrophic gill symbiont]|uniref:hypothetical protein n=1 Tax=Bathymodiolus japonicus methanotrophic gill symbiont TaxID=113269 RepID=UPI001B742201|nr:hypothetical protein [Bathymodiolus japonicus methanotrophic gill symbiont]GFO72103.1 hypothetical protein BJAS_P2077 [Bathymodiolus japonicus methanotrophic gill symbiont]